MNKFLFFTGECAESLCGAPNECKPAVYSDFRANRVKKATRWQSSFEMSKSEIENLEFEVE